MIRYLVVDEDGQLHDKQARDWWAVPDAVGPEGSNRVRLAAPDVCAYLNDVGLVLTEKYRRNVVAACMMVTLGAVPQAYAGPVVFCGWNHRATAIGEVEVCSLHDSQADTLRLLHSDVRRILGLDAGEVSGLGTAEWAEELRGYAAWMPTAPVPGLTMLTDPADIAAALRSMR